MKKSILSFLTVLIIIILQVSASFAQSDVEVFISDLSSRTLKVIESKEAENKKVAKLEKIFVNAVDIQWMAKFAIAKIWKSMTNTQKDEYLKAYRHYLIKTYVPRFKEYNNQVIKITGSKDIGNDQYIVSTQILSVKGPEKTTINVGYRCKKSDSDFKIRDITGEDFSLLSTQRSEFSSVVAKSGIDGLIKTLNAK